MTLVTSVILAWIMKQGSPPTGAQPPAGTLANEDKPDAEALAEARSAAERHLASLPDGEQTRGHAAIGGELLATATTALESGDIALAAARFRSAADRFALAAELWNAGWRTTTIRLVDELRDREDDALSWRENAAETAMPGPDADEADGIPGNSVILSGWARTSGQLDLLSEFIRRGADSLASNRHDAFLLREAPSFVEAWDRVEWHQVGELRGRYDQLARAWRPWWSSLETHEIPLFSSLRSRLHTCVEALRTGDFSSAETGAQELELSFAAARTACTDRRRIEARLARLQWLADTRLVSESVLEIEQDVSRTLSQVARDQDWVTLADRLRAIATRLDDLGTAMDMDPEVAIRRAERAAEEGDWATAEILLETGQADCERLRNRIRTERAQDSAFRGGRELIGRLLGLSPPLLLRVPDSISTIQHALRLARPGDVVYVSGGTHTGPIDLTDGVMLRGSAREQVEIVNAPDVPVVRARDRRGAAVCNITVRHDGPRAPEDHASAVELVDSMVTMTDCAIRCAAGWGIQIEGGGGAITNCTITECAAGGVSCDRPASPYRVAHGSFEKNRGPGIRCEGGAGVEILDSYCADNLVAGIAVLGQDARFEIRGNRCEKNRRSDADRYPADGHGILAENATASIQANICMGNTENGICARQTVGKVGSNTCSDNLDSGIEIDGSVEARLLTITANHCERNLRGIRAADAHVEIVGNTCSANRGDGIQVYRPEIAILITHNQCCANGDNGIHYQGSDYESLEAVDISQNEVRGNSEQGLRVAGRADAFSVCGNISTRNGKAGIQVQVQNGYLVSGNRCSENRDGIDVWGEAEGDGKPPVILKNQCDNNSEWGIDCPPFTKNAARDGLFGTRRQPTVLEGNRGTGNGKGLVGSNR